MQDLKAAIKPVVKNALVGMGGVIGQRVAGPSGAAAGNELGRRISKLIGSGDYASNETYSNSLIKGAAVPNLSFGKTALSIRVKHREFLGDIMTSPVAGQFVNYVYPINAGLRASFPYLSQLAQNYEEYCFHGLVFEFVSTASPYISTGAMGSNIAAMEYNANSPAFTSKFSMENSTAAISGRLDKNLMYGVECASNSNAQNCYYIRSGTTNLPLTTTDLGNFQFAVSPGAGVTTSSVVGELWVTYDCSLDRPVLNLDDIGYFHTYRTSPTSVNPLGTAANFSRTSGALSGSTASSSVISLSSINIGDTVMVTVFWVGTVAQVLAYPVVSTTNMSNFLGLQNNASGVQGSPPNGTTTSSCSLTYLFTVTAKNPTVTFAGGVIPTGTTTAEIIVTNLGNNLNNTSDW